MTSDIRLFHRSHNKRITERAHIRVPNSIHLLRPLHGLRSQHGSTVQRRWALERLLVRRKNVHDSESRGENTSSLASVLRNIHAPLDTHKTTPLFFERARLIIAKIKANNYT